MNATNWRGKKKNTSNPTAAKQESGPNQENLAMNAGTGAHTDLDVAVAHVVLVPPECKISVLLTDEAHQRLPVPATLGVQAERHPPSRRAKRSRHQPTASAGEQAAQNPACFA